MKAHLVKKTTVRTSLPPLVEGKVRGYVSVCLKEGLEWKCSVRAPAPKLSVRLKWWGEKSEGVLFRIPVAVGNQHGSGQDKMAAGSNVRYYPVKAGLSQLNAYFKDMGALVFEVGLGHMSDASMVIGRASIQDVTPLIARRILQGSFPIVSSGDVLLGKLHVVLQLHVKSVMAPKAAKHLLTADLSTEFVVGPGATFKERPPPAGKSATLKANRGKPRLVEPSMKSVSVEPSKKSGPDVGCRVHGDRRGDPSDGDRGPGGGPTDEGGPTEDGDPTAPPVLGKQQMEVVSELLEKGTMLRDKMVDSVATGTQLGHHLRTASDGEEGVVISPSVLALVSAELAAQDGKKNLADLVYKDFSDEDGNTSVGNTSMDELDTEAITHRGGTTRRRVTISDASPVIFGDADHGQVTIAADGSGDVPESLLSTALDGDGGGGAPLPRAQASGSPQADGRPQAAQATGTEPGGTQTVRNSSIRSDGASVEELEGKGRIVSASVTSLSSLFGEQSAASLEEDIARNVGLEQLTRLSRATCVRVVVGNLQVEPTALRSIIVTHTTATTKKNQSSVPSIRSATYFVEYQFPAVLLDSKTTSYASKTPSYASKTPSHVHQHVYEVMRVACKKMKRDGGVTFSHRSVFPVLVNSKVLLSWWNSSLIFRVYCKPQHHRMPFLIGKAVVSLKSWLMSPGLHSDCSLPVHSSTLAEAVHSSSTSDPCIGQLKVTMEMLMGKTPFPSLEVSGPPDPVRTGYPVSRPDDTRPNVVPIKLKETGPTLAASLSDSNKPAALQLVLAIPEGTDIQLSDTGPLSSPPNCYLVCKLFSGQPHPKTPVEWRTSNPQFLFRQLFPLCQRKDVIEKFCNNFCVVEVWHRVLGERSEDQLAGLVKLSLHQFFLSFSEPSSAFLSLQTKLPVVAVDSYCPVVDPISGHVSGHLAVLLALGSPDQVSYLLRQHASGCYPIQPGSLHSQIKGEGTFPWGQRSQKEGQGSQKRDGDAKEDPDEVGGSLTHHQFTVQIEGIRALEVAANTVWGEADCFIQYHFPAPTEGDDSSRIDFYPYRTPTTLYMPNPSFSHITTHLISLPRDKPIGQVLAGACGQAGMNGQIAFELWRRFYFPNIRDQLLAKASLPLVKLCAMVGMQGTTSSSQMFPLTLHPISVQPPEGSIGVLEVGIGYKALSQHAAQTLPDAPHVHLSVGILRMAGLKRAAALAAKDHPLPLDFAVEVGVNPYAKISAAIVLPKPCSTESMTRTFAPEMSHFIEVSVPIAVGKGGDIKVRPSREVQASELVEASLLVEVWHQVPKRREGGRSSAHTEASSGMVVGRRLGPSFQDVLLGVAYVPLDRLLKHTGIHGWYPLLPPATPHTAPVSGPTHLQQGQDPPVVTCAYVGGVELSAAFSTKADRQLVLSNLDPASCRPNRLQDVGGATQWEVELQVKSLWIEDMTALQSSTSGTTHCFLRYRFFDLDAVSSTPRLASFRREGHSHYPLQHKALFSLPHSLQLEWYLSEERLEVQVWASTSANLVRPAARDVLIGCVYVLLSDLLAEGGNLSGWYPVFKCGSDDLGEQAVYLCLRIAPTSESACGVRVLDSSVEVTPPTAPRTITPQTITPQTTTPPATTPPKTAPWKSEGFSREVVPDRLESVTFKARVIIHEALHLPRLKDARSRSKEYLPNAYVTLHPHPSLGKVTTPVVPASCKPSWNYQCVTHISTLHLESQSPGLEFQVWSSRAGPRGEDHHIGCVTVDLSLLAFGLAQVSGWYNIVNFAGDVCGQLKVSVQPNDRKSFPCQHPTSTLLQVSAGSTSDITSTTTTGTTSALFQQLRDNIRELNDIHLSLQTKLNLTEEGSSVCDPPSSSPQLQSPITSLQSLTTSLHQLLATSLNQPLTTSLNEPLTTSPNQLLATSLNQPLTTSLNEPLLTASQYQPLTTSQYQPLTTSLNQPLTTSLNQPLTTSLNQLFTTSQSQPPTISLLASSLDQPFTSLSEPPTTSLYLHQPPVASLHRPPITSLRHPQPWTEGPLPAIEEEGGSDTSEVVTVGQQELGERSERTMAREMMGEAGSEQGDVGYEGGSEVEKAGSEQSDGVSMGYEGGSEVNTGIRQMSMGYEGGSEVKTGNRQVSMGYVGGSEVNAGNRQVSMGYEGGSEVKTGSEQSGGVSMDYEGGSEVLQMGEVGEYPCQQEGLLSGQPHHEVTTGEELDGTHRLHSLSSPSSGSPLPQFSPPTDPSSRGYHHTPHWDRSVDHTLLPHDRAHHTPPHSDEDSSFIAENSTSISSHQMEPMTHQTAPTTEDDHSSTATRHSIPVMDLPWPNLPDYFLSPQALEQSLRTIRAASLSHFSASSSTSDPLLQQNKDQEVGGVKGRASRKPPRQPTQSETDRIAKIFSSRP